MSGEKVCKCAHLYLPLSWSLFVMDVFSSPPNASVIYMNSDVGNLDVDASDKDLEKAFGKFGAIRNIWIARKPPGR